MNFQPHFFKEEVRDGFYIEPMMKCAWAVQLDILEDIQNLCREYGIQYFVDGGTLLGTVRHNGYIPWDDDIDIAMLRPDYDRFMRIAQQVWKDKYSFRLPGITKSYDMTFMKIMNENTISFSTEQLQKNHGFPYVTGVDIFPLDIIPDDLNERTLFFRLYSVVAVACKKIKENPEKIEECLSEIENLCHYKINRNGDIQRQLCYLAELISKSYEDTNNQLMTMVSYNSQNIILKREWYNETEWMPFETLVVPVPKHYHEVLTAWYGNYMVPVQGTASHDYPFYKNQMEYLAEVIINERNNRD